MQPILRATRVLPVLATALLMAACNAEARNARELDARCSSGDSAACNELGSRAYRGDHVLRDWRRASRLFQDACDGEEGEGCVRLARLHVDASAQRRGVPLDSALAVDLLDRGCELGALVGCVELADMYAEADSVVPDVEPTGPLQDQGRAAVLYGKACDGGHLNGCVSLGGLYRDGSGVERDPERAVLLFRRACDGGAALGCARLGEAYLAGSGVAQDPAHGAELFEKSCETEMVGCFDLAQLLVEGVDAPHDYDRAVELFEKACRGTREGSEDAPPHAESCFRLGELYANGTGVDRDVYQAGSYFRRACRLGYSDACRRS